MAAIRPLLCALAAAVLCAAAAPAAADRDGPRGRMSHEERMRLRQDLVNSVREGRLSPHEARERMRDERRRRAMESNRLSPEEREKLRRDIMEANRDMERRR